MELDTTGNMKYQLFSANFGSVENKQNAILWPFFDQSHTQNKILAPNPNACTCFHKRM
jgi:hypothetical protein